jgi:hypothetical protein
MLCRSVEMRAASDSKGEAEYSAVRHAQLCMSLPSLKAELSSCSYSSYSAAAAAPAKAPTSPATPVSWVQEMTLPILQFQHRMSYGAWSSLNSRKKLVYELVPKGYQSIHAYVASLVSPALTSVFPALLTLCFITWTPRETVQ